MTDRRQMKLGLNIVANGAHAAGWRMPQARADALDFALWKRIARQAEAACIHFMFWADGIAVRHSARDEEELSFLGRIDVFEPLTLIGALSAVTDHLGFVATASTTYNEPYHIARKLASLDHISGGRVGWNVVTSWSEQEALNFGAERHMEHATRYRRAEEFIEVVMALWDGFEDDAFIRDKATGQYFDPAKLHTPNHRGDIFTVRGPLNIARPVQGFPLLVQAGSSGPGQRLGGRIADVIYTAQKTLAEATAFTASLRSQAAEHGRGANDILVMPGMMPILGATRQDAQDLFDQLQDLVHRRLGLPLLTGAFGDLSDHPEDAPVPDDAIPQNGVKSIGEALRSLASREKLSIRELYKLVAGASGHNIQIGTPADVADQMEAWFDAGACDGFNLMPAFLPGGVDDALGRLVPELQRRGVFQTSYVGTTLRENLGLARPGRGDRRAGDPKASEAGLCPNPPRGGGPLDPVT